MTIIGCVGSDAFVRGRDYARSGRVSDLVVNEEEQIVLGECPGHPSTALSDDRPAGQPAPVVGASGVCTCPVAEDCKHVAATLLAARDQGRPAAPARPAKPAWERPLAAVVDAHAAEQRAEGAPIALQFEVVAPSRPTRWAVAQSPAQARVSRVRLRPVVPGRSGGWIRTGISWRDLPYDMWNPRVRAHRAGAAGALQCLSSHGAPATAPTATTRSSSTISDRRCGHC